MHGDDSLTPAQPHDAVDASARSTTLRRRKAAVVGGTVAAAVTVGAAGFALASGWGLGDGWGSGGPVTLVAPSASSSPTPTVSPAPTPTATSAPTPEPTATPQPTPEQSAIPETDAPIDAGGPTGQQPGSAESLLVLVNKQNPLPRDFRSPDLVSMADAGLTSSNGHRLRAEAVDAALELDAAAREAGYELDFVSGYRSRSLQRDLYRSNVAELGRAAADRTSARPGHSEHETGLAVDIVDSVDDSCAFDACFGSQDAGRWLAENSWRYGFIVRYPAGAEDVTGFEYEPWHFRYVGTEVAADYHASGATTFEEYLGQPAAPNYPKR